MPFYRLPYELMGSHEDIYFSGFKIGKYLLCLLDTAGTGEVIYTHGKVF